MVGTSTRGRSPLNNFNEWITIGNGQVTVASRDEKNKGGLPKLE